MAQETEIPVKGTEPIVMRPARKVTLAEAQQLAAEHRELLDILAKDDGPVTAPRP